MPHTGVPRIRDVHLERVSDIVGCDDELVLQDAREMKDALENGAISYPSTSVLTDFIPRDSIQKIMSRKNIERLLLTSSIGDPSQLLDKICPSLDSSSNGAGYRRILATLLLIEEEKHILDFIEHDTQDRRLPLGHNAGFLRCLRNYKHFCRNQYRVISPVLMRTQKDVLHYKLFTDDVLPVADDGASMDEENPPENGVSGDPLLSPSRLATTPSPTGSISNPREGGFGTVTWIRLHEAHVQFGNYGVSIHSCFQSMPKSITNLASD
jgi:hypothetical protein